MNWLNNLNIRTRLYILMFVVLAGFTIIEVVDVLALEQNIAAEDTHENNAEFRFLTLKLEDEILQARFTEREFLITKDLKLVAEHDKIIEEVFETLEAIEEAEEGIGGELEELLEEDEGEDEEGTDEIIGELVKEYQADFKKTVAAFIELGLDENSGVQGEFRAEVNDIETLLAKEKQINLTASMLQMRRHEKDFLLRNSEESVQNMAKEQATFARLLKASALSAAEKKETAEKMAAYRDGFQKLVALTQEINADIEKDRQDLAAVEPQLELLEGLVAEKVKVDQVTFDQERKLLSFQILVVTIAVAFFIVIILSLLIRSMSTSLSRLGNTISEVASGNFEARSNLTNKDELGNLSRALDGLLDDRLSNLARASAENDRLNDSVIGLLEAVSDLSDRDLTVKVPVAEDVTGPVADAMNLLASETARVLNDIREVAGQVSDSALAVQSQGSKVGKLAENERGIVEGTIVRLEEASKTLNQVVKLAQACNETASKASSSTQEALETVFKTATGMGDIRETISETEKRIKRLGERSQEINGVVEIINNIAERTHVLALNASMQAAAAGDAGRGFAVVADEVQRLAESSRQSTSEIAGLVNNIQVETAETMATMNKTIAQVVEGTELAQASGAQMQATQKTTAELANAVEQIAKRSLAQSQVSDGLRAQAALVQASTQETGVELQQQATQTENLVAFSQRLIESVSVFKLPTR